MTVGRTRILVGAPVLALLLSLTSLQGMTPAHADPGSDLKASKKKVEALYAQAEQASERFNGAKLRLAESQTRLSALRADVQRQQRVVAGMRTKVAALLVSQYQGDPLSAASRVVFSADPHAFIDNLNAASSYSAQQGAVIAEYRVQLSRLRLRTAAARDQVASLSRIRSTLAAAKATIDKKAAAAKAEYDDLSGRARAAMLAGADAGDLSGLDLSGRAGPVVKFALAQVGKAYVWGATGPNAYDCSGLTMAAWRQAGVNLPHYSRAQMSAGRPVSRSELQPGDLVFFYSPVSHVAIYIGNGLIVGAQNPRTDVRVTRIDSMPFTAAVRPG